MKTTKSILLLVLLMISAVACKYDDAELWDKVNSLDDRVTSIEDKLKAMNSDISALQALANALQNKVYVESVEYKDDGYVITFTDGTTATISNGKNGEDGKDGVDGKDGKDAPVIGIDEYEGKYYWTQTVNAVTSWLNDAEGNKIPVTGADAITPQMKVDESGYWIISYDNGISFIQVLDDKGNPVKAVGKDGEDGKDGSDGINGDSFFRSVRTEGAELIFTLADGREFRVPLSISISTLDNIVKINDGIGEWNEAYITSHGYFCYSNKLPEDKSEGRSFKIRADSETQKVLNFMSTDGKSTASMLLSATEELPLQLITDDGTLNFSYPNDSILELVYDNGSKLEMLDSISYSRKEMETTVSTLKYDTQLQKALYYFISLVKGHTATHFDELISIFSDVLKLKIDVNSEATIGKLGLSKDDATFTFITDMNSWYQVTVVTKVYYSVVMWTGKASYKVGGSSCTLSGTIWCASQTFNEYGTYGIVCDENPDNLTLEKAEYKGEGFQDKLKLSYDVDFRGFKPNTKYYYRAYYKFNSGDHGKLRFKYGDKNAQIGYDYVVKSFVTGDNTLNVDVVMCIDVTGSMSGIINTVKSNALSFYDSFESACTRNGIGLTSLNTQVIAFRDKNVDGDQWLLESPVYSLPDNRSEFDSFVNALYADGGGDTPESGLEALDRAFSKSDWGKDDGYHRQVVILWTDAPYLVGTDYTALTSSFIENKWNNMPSGRRFILFAPYGSSDFNGGNWGDFDGWKNIIHLDELSSGFGDMDYILEAIIGELTGRAASKASRSYSIKLVSTPNY